MGRPSVFRTRPRRKCRTRCDAGFGEWPPQATCRTYSSRKKNHIKEGRANTAYRTLGSAVQASTQYKFQGSMSEHSKSSQTIAHHQSREEKAGPRGKALQAEGDHGRNKRDKKKRSPNAPVTPKRSCYVDVLRKLKRGAKEKVRIREWEGPSRSKTRLQRRHQSETI